MHEMSLATGDVRRDDDGGDREAGKRRRTADDDRNSDMPEADAKKTRYESRRICQGARNEYEASMSSSMRLSQREVCFDALRHVYSTIIVISFPMILWFRTLF